jgi:hypothetical protein
MAGLVSPGSEDRNQDGAAPDAESAGIVWRGSQRPRALGDHRVLVAPAIWSTVGRRRSRTKANHGADVGQHDLSGLSCMSSP